MYLGARGALCLALTSSNVTAFRFSLVEVLFKLFAKVSLVVCKHCFVQHPSSFMTDMCMTPAAVPAKWYAVFLFSELRLSSYERRFGYLKGVG
jgi:hypothetical protein